MRKHSAQQKKSKPLVIELPLFQHAAIYAIGVSQVDELLKLADMYGYEPEHISVYLDEEAQETHLEKRLSYQSLLQAIREKHLSVIFLLDVAGLFSHASKEDVDTFIIAGMWRGIFVVTPQSVFSFSNLTSIVAFRKVCTAHWNLHTLLPTNQYPYTA